MIVNIPDTLFTRIKKESDNLNITSENRILDILEKSVAPETNFDNKSIQPGLEKIKTLLTQIPGIKSIGISKDGEPFWWLKFGIDIDSPIAWHIIQELGHILNYLSVNEKLPVSFYPVSPPPYMNGGPGDFLSWVIEASIPFVDTNIIYDYLEGGLPDQYSKEESWLTEE